MERYTRVARWSAEAAQHAGEWTGEATEWGGGGVGGGEPGEWEAGADDAAYSGQYAQEYSAQYTIPPAHSTHITVEYHTPQPDCPAPLSPPAHPQAAVGYGNDPLYVPPSPGYPEPDPPLVVWEGGQTHTADGWPLAAHPHQTGAHLRF